MSLLQTQKSEGAPRIRTFSCSDTDLLGDVLGPLDLTVSRPYWLVSNGDHGPASLASSLLRNLQIRER